MAFDAVDEAADTIREGRSFIGQLLRWFDPMPFDPWQDQTIAGAIAVIGRVQEQL